jgi:hypothetical protein
VNRPKTCGRGHRQRELGLSETARSPFPSAFPRTEMAGDSWGSSNAMVDLNSI